MNWDHLFEWYLAQQLNKRTNSKIRAARRSRGRDWDYTLKPDIKNPQLAYDHRGQLNLADVKPRGFLVKSKI